MYYFSYKVPLIFFRTRSTLKSTRIKSIIAKTPSRSRRAISYRTPRLETVPWHRVSGQTSAKKRDAKMWSEDLNGMLWNEKKYVEFNILGML